LIEWCQLSVFNRPTISELLQLGGVFGIVWELSRHLAVAEADYFTSGMHWDCWCYNAGKESACY